MLTVYIGYDSREPEAYEVARFSLLDRAKAPLRVRRVEHRDLRRRGIFRRPWRIDAGGQYWDETDGRPFSTEFSFTRFLVPEMARREGIDGWALFVDSDVLFRADVTDLLELTRPDLAALCVQHRHEPGEGQKMDGMRQCRYHRKNWSSVMLLNLDHAANRALTPDVVNSETGSWLHALGWLPDDLIGALPTRWNWLAGTSDPAIDPAIVHFTEGGPWLEEYAEQPYAHAWRQALLASHHPRPMVRERMIEAAA